MDQQYEDQVRTSFKRMETGEIIERLKGDSLTDVARHIATEELGLRDTEADNLAIAQPKSGDASSRVEAPSTFLNTPKYAFLIATGIALFLALYLGLFKYKPEVADTLAAAAAQGISLAVLILLVLFTNSSLNKHRQKNDKPLRTLGHDALNIFLGLSVILALYVGALNLFG